MFLSSIRIAPMHYLLEISKPELKSSYIAVRGFFAAISFGFPIIGGVVVQAFGYNTLLIAVFIITTLGVIPSKIITK